MEENKAAAESSGSWVNIKHAKDKDTTKTGELEKENEWECTGMMVDMSCGGLLIDQNKPFAQEQISK